MRNNSKEAEGNGYPLRITAVEVKVVDNPEAGAVGAKEIDFVKHMLPILEWSALVQVGSMVLFIPFFCSG
jgi:deoxyribose-phosphate aldolase